jgi:hypothetical protein
MKKNTYLEKHVYPYFGSTVAVAEEGVTQMAVREGISYMQAVRALWPYMRRFNQMQQIAFFVWRNGYAEVCDDNPFTVPALEAGNEV